jgi:hypothetical protein
VLRLCCIPEDYKTFRLLRKHAAGYLQGMQTAEQTEEQPPHLFQRGRSGNPLGRRLQKNRVAEDEAARAAEVEAILGDFGHQPSHLERCLIDELAAGLVQARRFRVAGKPALATECTRLVSRLAAQLGVRRDVRPGKGRPTGPTLQEYLAQRSASAPVAQPAQEAVAAPPAEKTHHEPPDDDGEASDDAP